MLSVATASKTQRLYLLLRHQILGGELNAGEKLPSEPELGALHTVSRVTVRRVLGQLEDEGLISRHPGVGTFVKERAVSRPIVAELTDALANLNEMGRVTSVKLLSFAYVQPPAQVAIALNIARDTRTQRSVRIRLSNKDPFSYLLTHVPERISSTYSEQELATQSFLSLLERSGVRIARATQTVTATLATPEIAEALKIDIGAPLLSITRVNFDQSGEGVQHLQAYYRPDRYRFEMHLVRGQETESFVWTADTQGKEAAA
jgi:GntR family transcriptional regulator